MLSKTAEPIRWEAHGVGFDYLAALLGAESTRGIMNSLGVRPEVVIDYVVAWKVLNASVARSGDESHRLSGDGVPEGNFDLLMASVLQGENLTDGLRRFAVGARILRPDLKVLVAVHGCQPRLTIDFASPGGVAQDIYLEALIVVMHCAVRWSLERSVKPVRVRGPTGVDGACGSFLNLLGKPVRREGAGVTIVYEASDGVAPFRVRGFARWHDATFAEYTKLVDERAAQAPDDSSSDDDLIRAVRGCVLEGPVSQAQVARRLGMSVATLRRRLADHGASFRDIVSAARRDAAAVLLFGDKSVDDIAAELGLSDSRCFRRACHGWFGGAPSEVRRSIRERAVLSDSVRA